MKRYALAAIMVFCITGCLRAEPPADPKANIYEKEQTSDNAKSETEDTPKAEKKTTKKTTKAGDAKVETEVSTDANTTEVDVKVEKPAPAEGDPPLIKRVAHTTMIVSVPQIDRGWWTWKDWFGEALTKKELHQFAELYETYENPNIESIELNRMNAMLRLLAADADYYDEDLKELLLVQTFSIKESHPLKGFLIKKWSIEPREFSEGSEEYSSFTERMAATAERYGIK